MLSHLDYIFSSSDLVLALIWFLDLKLLEIEMFGEQLPVFHACAYSSGHVTANRLCSLCLLVPLRLLEACLFILYSIVGGEVAQPPVLYTLLCHGLLSLRH